MNAAQLYFVVNGQDDKTLSCRRWFISVLLINFNAFILGVFLLAAFGFLAHPFDNAAARAAAARIEVETAPEVNALEMWNEAKRVKYARYKVSYPKEGIVHAKGIVPVGKGFVKVNILEINKNLNKNLEIKPKTAAYTHLNSRVKIKTIAESIGAIAAVNGGYFKPETGVPLGALVIENELITGPIYNRAAFSINNDGTYSVGKTDIKFYLKNKNFKLKIDNLNQPRMLASYTLLYTEKWGKKSPPPPKNGAATVIKNGTANGLYTGSVNIPEGGYVVVAPKTVIKTLLGKNKLALEIIYPPEFSRATHVISGGPYLVLDGEIFIDAKDEKLGAITGRNPRTLVGYTDDNELILVTVDGRERNSIGMSLYEAAKFMKSLSCRGAVNLDGGSSSVMYVNGKITNSPPVEGGIPLSGVLAVSEKQEIATGTGNTDKM